MEASCRRWGICLVDDVDYVDLVSHKVCWKDPFSLPIGRELARNFDVILASKVVSLTGGYERLMWCFAKIGLYSVKSSYETLLGLSKQHDSK